MFIVDLIRILSVLLAIVGTTFLIPAGVAVYCGEFDVISSFLVPMLVSWILCAAMMFFFRKRKISLNVRETYFVVACCWIFTSFFGMIPLLVSGAVPNFADALYESVSGFTTTGATVIGDVESLPRSINLWRCLTHWLGGMGIVVLTVALLPLLGVGGFQLIKAETTGPEKGKVTAKITTTAKILWISYLILTVLQAILLKIFGMDFIDAFAHAFATLGTGGFSTKNASIGAYNSTAIDVICTVFMFLAGINFSLFYFAVRGKWREIYENSELKAYFGIFVFFAVSIALCVSRIYGSFWTALKHSAFQTASIITTTGFSTADFIDWPSTAQFFIFVLFFIGGCSGSTGGGIKVIRWVILCKQVNNEIRKMIHPHGVFSLRINNNPARKGLVFSVASFLLLYFLLILVTTFVGCVGKLDIFTAFTGALSMVGNIGPGFGALSPSGNYGFLPDFVKLWYCFAMLAGRLELYTMLIFFVPAYWKK